MSRDYGKIFTAVWWSRKFRALGADDRSKLLYLHLHTCQSVNSVGCFKLPVGYVVADLGWTAEDVGKAIDRLSEVELIEWNSTEEVVRIIDFIEHDPPTNPKHAMSVINIALKLPDCREKLNTLRDLQANSYARGSEDLAAAIDRLTIAYRDPIETPNPNPNPIPNPIPTSSLRSEEGVAQSELPGFLPPKDEAPFEIPECLKRTQPSKAAAAPPPPRSSIELPDWLPREAWAGFVEMRRKIRVPLTDRAIKLAIRKLEELRAQGFDPRDVLDQTTMNGWKGLFPVKPTGATNGTGPATTRSPASSVDTTLRGIAAALRDTGGGDGGSSLPDAA